MAKAINFISIPVHPQSAFYWLENSKSFLITLSDCLQNFCIYVQNLIRFGTKAYFVKKHIFRHKHKQRTKEWTNEQMEGRQTWKLK